MKTNVRLIALVSIILVAAVSILLSGGVGHAILDNNLKVVDLTDLSGALVLPSLDSRGNVYIML